MVSSIHLCPSCGSRSSKRCEVAYEQATREGPRVYSQQSFSSRISPPIKPWSWLVAAISCLVIGVVIMATPGYSVYLGYTSFTASAFLIFIYKNKLVEYEKNFDLYKKLWVCLDCGKIYLKLVSGKESNSR